MPTVRKPCRKHPELRGERNSSGRCALCQKEANKRYYEANGVKLRERARERSAQWYMENRERALTSAREWHLANPEKAREALRRWKVLNLDRVRAENRIYALRWVKENYERKLVANARRRAAKRGVIASLDAISKARYQELYDLARARTAQTGIAHHVDHDKPLALGGVDHPDNMHVVTAALNLAKGARYVSTLDFMLS